MAKMRRIVDAVENSDTDYVPQRDGGKEPSCIYIGTAYYNANDPLVDVWGLRILKRGGKERQIEFKDTADWASDKIGWIKHFKKMEGYGKYSREVDAWSYTA
ncbi:hypothetical protein LTR17_004399 [Elasticomyces elasticus]|nr:hypothetical protein LTR17_004399 [Elasticomyces elasticus]